MRKNIKFFVLKLFFLSLIFTSNANSKSPPPGTISSADASKINVLLMFFALTKNRPGILLSNILRVFTTVSHRLRILEAKQEAAQMTALLEKLRAGSNSPTGQIIEMPP